MFGRRIRGRSPLNVHRLFEDIRRSGFFEGAQSGMYVAVLSAIESALWDLAGKALNLPVYQLLVGSSATVSGGIVAPHPTRAASPGPRNLPRMQKGRRTWALTPESSTW